MIALATLVSVTACLEPSAPNASLKVGSSSDTSASPTPDASSTPVSLAPAGGPRAAKIIFKQSFPAGSFDAPPVGGTAAQPGSGHPAVRVFNADGSLLSQGGPSAATWPKWLTLVEIGISGSNNVSAKDPDCARFTNNTGEANTMCDFTSPLSTFTSATVPGLTYNKPCAASAGLYRVSEYDCVKSATTLKGTGGGTDGVYIRATFSRDPNNLGAYENIMAVLEYAASSIHPAPKDPRTCFTNGVFDTTNPNCADETWQIFIKHSTGEVVQPYLLLVPPAFASVDLTLGTGGSGVGAKQFYIPLAGDTSLNTVQISRISSLNSGVIDFFGRCGNPAGTSSPANTPLCVGMVLYSITFYRI